MRPKSIKRYAAGIVAAAFMAGLLAPGLRAQYYGRNKVQYEAFDFKIMKTRHFDIYYYLSSEETVKLAALMAERWYSRLSRMFNYEMRGRQPLILYGSSPEFQQTTVIPGAMGEGTGGVTESFKRRIVLPYGATLTETDHVIGHELVHAFQYDLMAQGHSDQARMYESNLRIPLWFIEGMAEYMSIGSLDPNTAMWMRDAVRRKDLPTIRKLDNYYKYFPYRWGQAFWAYVTGRWGDEMIGKIMKTTGRGGDYELVFEALLGVKTKQLGQDWAKAMTDAYSSLLDVTQDPAKISRTLFKGTENSIYNISPAISPDGSQVVMLSSRDLFSIDMYLADSETGKIKRKLISTAVDPHFESIEFIRSAGSWDAEGERFVFGGVAKGRPILTIMDMKKNKTLREIPFPELGEILTPSWSPDGRYITFSALAGGITDIFVYDLTNNVLKQMTRDVYGDIHPAWSPDGKTIAFSTERFSTNLDWVDIGNYELALLDVETGQVRKVLAFPNGKNIDPQWTPDGRGLYFVSDQNGKDDLYRIDLESGQIYQVTNLYTGISGITEISPSISVARTGRIVFSAYDGSYYSLFSLDNEEELQGQTFLAQFERDPALLPPRTQPEGALLGLLKNPLFGLPKDTNFAVTDYKPKLSLDYVSPPTIAIGVDRYGTYGAGGISAYWSDMLGYHTIITTAITGPSFIDTSGVLAYLNSKKRLNWGAALQRLVYPYPYYLIQETEFAGEPALEEIQDIYRIMNYDISGFGSYPLDSVRRIEGYAGFRYIDFSETVYRNLYSLVDGSLILHDKQTVNSQPSLNYSYLTLSYYYDTGIFGATSPILGQNYGISVSPAVGFGHNGLTFTTLALDFRKYVIPVRPFTVAFRALHYGRYGKNAEDDRLYPLYIAYWDLVRGYESFTSGEVTRAQEMGREPFDYNRLFGSKLIVANVELRFPVFGVLGLGKGYFGVWPLEFYGFYDWGVAYANQPGYWWGGNEAKDVKAWFLGGSRYPISSAGIGLRTNLFGALVLGLNYVYPISRPERGWHFQLSLSPGF